MSEEKINLKDNLKYYFKVVKPYKFSLIIIILILLSYASIEVGQNYLLKILIDNANLFVAKSISTYIFVQIIIWIGLFYLASVITASVLKYYRMIFLNNFEVKAMFDAKADIFNHLTKLSHSFHTTNRTGSLISKMIRIGKGIEALTDFLTFHGTPLLLKIIVSFIIIAFFDVYSALIVLAVCIIFVVVSVYLLGKQQKINLERNETEDLEKGFISDVFTNIETIKHFGKEDRINKMYSTFSKRTTDTLKEFWDFYAFVDFFYIFLLGIGMIFLMYFTLNKLIVGELSVGSLVFIHASYIGLIMPLMEFMWGVRRTYEAMSDIQAVVEFKKITPSIKDKTNAKKIKINKGEVIFKDINFTYGRKKVIKNFSLHIKPKEKVAFVGHSGAGKTTLIKLLYRLYDVQEGKINIDGQDICDVLQESLRSELSIVPQECILFNDSIYNNILFSNPSASRKEVFNALKIAQLYDFVKELPEKENTIVGERGIKLSGGEKQRVSIARAVIANKKILVLDEATSALDSQTEKKIQKALFKLMQGKTTIIIAHRLSTIMNADKIVVIENGKIKQVGSHAELTSKKGIYKTLWGLQKSKDIHR